MQKVTGSFRSLLRYVYKSGYQLEHPGTRLLQKRWAHCGKLIYPSFDHVMNEERPLIGL